MNCSTASGDDAEEEEEEEEEEGGEEEELDTFVAASAASKASSEESSVTLPPVAELVTALDEKVRNDDVKGERKGLAGLAAAAKAAAPGGRRLRSRAAEVMSEEEIDAD